MSSRKPETPSSGAPTSITDDRRTTAASCGFIGRSVISGGSGLAVVLVEQGCRGRNSKRSYSDTRCCNRGSSILAKGQRATLEEPAAVILLGGVCEGGEPTTSW